MKSLIAISMCLFCAFAVQAQTNTPPVTNNPEASHAAQGSSMYFNNAEWYNKDNVPPDATTFPANADYIQPGNSNPQNTQLYNGTVAPQGKIYNTNTNVLQPDNVGTFAPSGKQVNNPNASTP